MTCRTGPTTGMAVNGTDHVTDGSTQNDENHPLDLSVGEMMGRRRERAWQCMIEQNVTSMEKMAVKKVPKRRNTEKRKERSRNAARFRRSKEADIFFDVSQALPLPQNVCSQLDKSSLMRLAVNFIHIRQMLPISVGDTEKEIIDHLNYLDGFLMVISHNGDIVFVSQAVSNHIGLTQVDLTGRNIYEYSHPCDHEEISTSLLVKSNTSKDVDMFLRLKNTLTNKGKCSSLKSASWKVLHCKGRFLSSKCVAQDEQEMVHHEEHMQDGLVLIAEPLHCQAVNDEIVVFGKETFVTQNYLDMKFLYVEDRIKDLIGYDADELIASSLFSYIHAFDSDAVEKLHKNVLRKGQAEIDQYRFLAKNGGYVWMRTECTIITDIRNGKPEGVSCIHYLLTNIESPLALMSSTQAWENTICAADDQKEQCDEKTEDIKPSLTSINGKELDLIQLAPEAGDACIPLGIPTFDLGSADVENSEMFDDGFIDRVLDAPDFVELQTLWRNLTQDETANGLMDDSSVSPSISPDATMETECSSDSLPATNLPAGDIDDIFSPDFPLPPSISNLKSLTSFEDTKTDEQVNQQSPVVIFSENDSLPRKIEGAGPVASKVCNYQCADSCWQHRGPGTITDCLGMVNIKKERPYLTPKRAREKDREERHSWTNEAKVRVTEKKMANYFAAETLGNMSMDVF